MDRERENGRGRDPSSSSDDDDDLETLIAQNEAKPSNPPRRLSGNPRRGSFEIGDIRDRIGRRVSSSRKWLLLLAICVAVVIVLVYFFVDLREVGRVSPVPSSGVAYGSERMREAELRALYLLRDQQLGLLTLWNRTYSSHARSGSRGGTSSTTPQLPPQQPPPTPPMSPPPPAPAMSSNYTKNSSFSLNSTVRHDLVNDFSSLPPTVTLEEFRSALLEQIKLNREIQKVLLSTHHSGNGSWEAPEDNVDAFLADSSGEVCRKVGKPNGRRTLEWKPKKNRYLFAICLSGQMSNHLICLEKHMFFAALLNRVLVFPSPKFDYQYDRVIDINHINECFGRKVVITFDEFAEMKKNKMRIDRFICYMADPPCYVDEDHAKRLKSLGITLAKIEAAWPEDAKSHEQKKRIAGDITAKFASDDEVLAIGDVFYADVEEEWVMQPGGPLAHKCKTVIQPSRLITLTAERFVQTFLGSSFIALHFRRHGFLKFCNVKEESCFFPIPQAAECILHVVERANAPVIYLSTDAAESETKLLQSLVVLNDKQVPLVKRPEHNSVEKWDALLYRNHLGGDGQVEAMLDKTICALSSVFIGSSGSTFTDDILRLRKDWGSASICDEYLCQGEHPNFVASNE